MRTKILALLIVLLALALPSAAAFAQGTSDPAPTQSQVFLYIMLGGQILTLIGLGVAGFALWNVAGLKASIVAARNDIPGMNKLEAGLVDVLKPSGVDALNLGGNALANLITFAFASKIDPEALEAIKSMQDYFNNITDRKPNLPPDYGGPTTVTSAVKAPSNVGPSVTAEVR